MNEPYSPWHQRNSAGEEPLAARYTGSEPILWNGSMVYPMYSDRVGTEPILLYMTLLSQAPPAGLRGHGLGLSVLHGYIDLDGHKLTGVDIWSDALARGVTVELVPTGQDAMFSLTPVWVDQAGAHRNWTGNYGMLVEDIPNDIVALWCSLGEGPPNFANLVVGVGIAPVRPGTRESARRTDTDTAETPSTDASFDSGADSGEWEQTTGTRSETGAAERVTSDPYADPAPMESPYADSYSDSAYADDRLTDSRVTKERLVRRGEDPPPTVPAPPFVDENATMTMKYTLPPWGAVPARTTTSAGEQAPPAPARLPAPEPLSEPLSGPGSVWDSVPTPEPLPTPEPGLAPVPPPRSESVWESLSGPAPEADVATVHDSAILSAPPAVDRAPESETSWTAGPAPASEQRWSYAVPPEPVRAPAPEKAPEPAWSTDSGPEPTTPAAASENYEPLEQPAPAFDPALAPSPAQVQASEPGAAYRNALYELGTAMYNRGEDDQACGLWAQAAEAGHGQAGHDLAVLLFRRGDHATAEGWWRIAAEYGEFRSMSLLAELLDRRGEHDEAGQWRTRAAEYAARAGQTLYS